MFMLMGGKDLMGSRPIRWGAGGKRRDKNEPAIIDALEAIGVTVKQLSGRGLPDLLAFHPHEGLRLIEVKSKDGSLTEAQKTTHRDLPICVVRTEAEALAIFGVRL